MDEKEKPFVSMVVYIGKNKPGLTGFVNKLATAIDNKFESYEIILVKDEIDGIDIDWVRELSPRLMGKLIVAELAWNHGIDLGFLAGTDFAIGDFIFEVDTSVLDYSESILYKLYQKACEGFDIVIASPRHRSISISSRVFYRVLRRTSYRNFNVSTERIRVVTRKALNSVSKIKDKGHYRKILYQYSGFPSCRIEYTPKPHVRSSRGVIEKASQGVEMMLSFSSIGLKLSLVSSAAFLIASVALGIYALIIYFGYKTRVEGWTTLMLFLSFGFSGMFLVTGLLSKYLSLILQEVRNRPLYTVKSISRH